LLDEKFVVCGRRMRNVREEQKKHSFLLLGFNAADVAAVAAEGK